MSEIKVFAGIGSRETPPEILERMERDAIILSRHNYILASGGADGADSAFEKGAGSNKRIFLPWRNFNNRPVDNRYYNWTIPRKAYEIAEEFHPAWGRLSQGAKHLMARNVQQVLGVNCNEPVDFILCYHRGKGGTTQACRIAESYNIPVFNYYKNEVPANILDLLTARGEL